MHNEKVELEPSTSKKALYTYHPGLPAKIERKGVYTTLTDLPPLLLAS